MKIAIISVKPATLNSGAEVRNYYIKKALIQKFNVSYYTPTLPTELPQDNILKRVGNVLMGRIPYIEFLRMGKFNSSTLSEIIKSDIILFEEMESYYFFEKYLNKCNSKLVIDTHNVDYLRFISEIQNKSIIERVIGQILAVKLKKMEINAIRHVNHIIVCSEIEKKYFIKYIQNEKISVIPNGVNINEFKFETDTHSNDILFMGLLSYPPNEYAIKFYINNIHNLVISKSSNSKLIILGRGAPKWLIRMSKINKSIKLVGYVDDVKDYIKKVKVCICPIISGSGTRLKILEYMSMGKPVVSTPKGAEGIDVVHNKNILLASTDKDYANAIIKLLNDQEMYNEIAINARKLIEDKYNWQNISIKIGNVMSKI